MKKILIALVILMFTAPDAYSHSGRTDKNGGHNCSEKSKKKGLCTGYHYHKKGENSQEIVVLDPSAEAIDHHHDGDEEHSHNGDDPQG